MSTHVAHHFDDAAQQFDASRLGMWIFLATEVMFFGGALTGYAYYRVAYPEAFVEGSHHLNLVAGTVNTAVLLTSSLTMALAIRAAQTGARRAGVWLLAATLVLGAGFLGIKAYEYYEEFALGHVPGPSFVLAHAIDAEVNPKHVELFFSFYFGLTGLHAVHMIIGLATVAVIAWQAHKRRFSPAYYTPVEITGLYWHFVDMVWVFLFPLLYLVR